MARYYGPGAFAGDPHWITVKYGRRCGGCNALIKKGARAFYYPKGKAIYCETCGEGEGSRFTGACQDEAMYNRGCC